MEVLIDSAFTWLVTPPVPMRQEEAVQVPNITPQEGVQNKIVVSWRLVHDGYFPENVFSTSTGIVTSAIRIMSFQVGT